MLSVEALNKFKEIWKAEKGIELSDSEATEEAIKLLTLFDVVFRPIMKDWLNETNDDKPTKKTKTI